MKEGLILVFSDKKYHDLYHAIPVKGENVEVHSCEEAFDVIKDCQADIILIDCGYDIKRALRLLKESKTLHPTIPVIFLADVSSEDNAVEAFRSGARDYFRKPVNIFELQETIRSLLKIKRSSKEKRSPFLRSTNNDIETIPITATTSKPLNLLKVVRYIEEKLDEEICLTDCAKRANLSKHHFCRSFKKYIGMSPMRFVTFLRIGRAKELLRGEDLNITEVALQAGFNDHSSFVRGFKKLTGVTPKKYRDSIKTK